MLDMLTADVQHHDHSGLHLHAHTHHGHVQQGNGSFFAQMPLSLLGSVLRRQSPAPGPQDQAGDHLPQSQVTTQASTPAISPVPSRPVSVSSLASADERPRKRTVKPKTTFNLAHPPPLAGPRHKLHLRQKVLLQLHQVIPGRRPKPVYELIPFSLLAPRSTRRLARTFNSKDRLGPGDLLLVRAEDYGTHQEDEKTDDERWGTREVIGIICPAKRSERDPADRTELLMDDGSHWEVTNMANGGYEFAYTDEHGLTLKRRWIPKPAASRRTSTMSNPDSLPSPGLGPEDKKFNFSTISPNSRRHPVIASLSRARIDVQDTYTIPSATQPPTPGPQSSFSDPLRTPASVTSMPDLHSFLDKDADRHRIVTDESLRRFILLSGIWIALAENWSAAYSTTKSLSCPYTPSSPCSSRPTPNRAVSMSFLDSPRSVSPASTIDDTRRNTTIPKLFRSGSSKAVSASSSGINTNVLASPTLTINSTQTSPANSPIFKVKNRSRRANSTGTADLNPRATSARKQRFPLAFEDQTLAETEEERQSKRSMELLRIKTDLRETPVPSVPTPAVSLTPGVLSPTLQPSPEIVTSPPSPEPNARTRKTQSAYNPLTTAGLWDSGVEKQGVKRRPTSMVVLGSRRGRDKVKSKDRAKEKNKEKDNDKDREKGKKGFRQRLAQLFRREKS